MFAGTDQLPANAYADVMEFLQGSDPALPILGEGHRLGTIRFFRQVRDLGRPVNVVHLICPKPLQLERLRNRGNESDVNWTTITPARKRWLATRGKRVGYLKRNGHVTHRINADTPLQGQARRLRRIAGL